jgi:CpeT protein
MNRINTILPACLLVLASLGCSDGDESSTTPSNTDAGVDAPESQDANDAASEDADDEGSLGEAAADVAAPDADAMLAAYLTGRFDSEAQSQSDPAYFAIQLIMCPVSVPDLGERVLYVEQAVMGSEPYRQRLYVVEPLDPPKTHAVSKVYELADPTAAAGWCDDPTSLTLAAADTIERNGCHVEMEWKGDHFEGGTVGTTCTSSLQGASYATSEVEITDGQLSSWDRGFDAQGTQAWGATKGPYVFDRKTALELP